MSLKKSIFIFSIIMATGITASAIVRNGGYPVAMVNYRFISETTLQKSTETAYGYLQNILSLSGADPEKLNAPDSYRELKREALDDLISRELIRQELGKRMSDGERDTIAARNIAQLLEGNIKLEEGVEKLYGLTMEEFKARLLMPQAYSEILEGRMNLNNEDFSIWLMSARKNSSVAIFYPGFSWDGEKVIAK